MGLHIIRKHSRILIAVVCVGVLLTVLAPRIRSAGEDIGYRMNPSAQKAFDLAEQSFIATRPARYDIARAEYYFGEALRQDPHMPYLYHELARIAFLKGDLAQAYARINYDIAQHGDTQLRSYYIRGLIAGYMGLYDQAINDFGYFAALVPDSWAGANDYGWVLVKAGRAEDAAEVTSKALEIFPNNPWLLNTNAIALAEMGKLAEARIQIDKAARYAQAVTHSDWLYAYPGNDPASAPQGVEALKKSVIHTKHLLEAMPQSGGVQ